jgi:hypothetical protein
MQKYAKSFTGILWNLKIRPTVKVQTSETDGHFRRCEWNWNVSYKEEQEEQKKKGMRKTGKKVGRSFF